MAQDNRQQIDYWNDRAGATWAELQDRLDQLLAPLSAAALAAANVLAAPEQEPMDVGNRSRRRAVSTRTRQPAGP